MHMLLILLALCLRKSDGISHLFSIAYAFAGNGCQVMEIPPIQPVVTEYQWHQLVCPACGETTRAPWPAGVPSGTYGPRVHATVALCTGAYRLSKRMTGQVMDDVFGVPMSVGTVSQALI